MSTPVELLHRIKHELPPYPMQCAMQNRALKKRLNAITQKSEFSTEDMAVLAEVVLGSLEVRKLEAEFREYGRKELASNVMLKRGAAKELAVLVEALSLELTFV